MSTRAKFKVTNVAEHGDIISVELNAVTEKDSDNEDFYKYTPAGSVLMHISNPAVFDFFKLGKSYYLDFSEIG